MRSGLNLAVWFTTDRERNIHQTDRCDLATWAYVGILAWERTRNPDWTRRTDDESGTSYSD